MVALALLASAAAIVSMVPTPSFAQSQPNYGPNSVIRTASPIAAPPQRVESRRLVEPLEISLENYLARGLQPSRAGILPYCERCGGDLTFCKRLDE
jgi:hypothetical protein